MGYGYKIYGGKKPCKFCLLKLSIVYINSSKICSVASPLGFLDDHFTKRTAYVAILNRVKSEIFSSPHFSGQRSDLQNTIRFVDDCKRHWQNNSNHTITRNSPPDRVGYNSVPMYTSRTFNRKFISMKSKY